MGHRAEAVLVEMDMEGMVGMNKSDLIDDIPQKSIEDSFRDWESNAFGFGYGSGEEHVIPALRRFMELCSEPPLGGSYDYRKLEAELGPAVAWLLINMLCHHRIDMIEYGTSPRCGWLTKTGERLKEFMLSKTSDELVELATNYDQDHTICMPDACNCGPKGYVEGRKCPNPFWDDKV